MKDYPFSFEQLFKFANQDPYRQIPDDLVTLFEQLEIHRERLNFPAVQNDIGCFIQFLTGLIRPQVVFEMGSGYGQSAFWFLTGSDAIERVILTEKRKDLERVFKALPWPEKFKSKLSYHQEDAFDVLVSIERIDMILIDGVKSDYLKFLKAIERKVHGESLVFIDNSYWRGSFLDTAERAEHRSARKIAELHEFLASTNFWKSCFIPYYDGLTLLYPVI